MRKSAMRELAESIYIMDEIDPSEFDVKEPPVVTIYIPMQHTDRDGRRNEWDRIEYKDLSNKAIKDMQEHWGKDDVQSIVDKLEYLQTNNDLPAWDDAKRGLAILVDKDGAYIYNMDEAPKSSVTVSDKFDMSQILGAAARDEANHYKLLLLSSDYFGLLDGDENNLSYVTFPEDIKHYFTETFAEYDGDKAPLDYYSLEDHQSPFHGHKSRNDVTKEETKKFFRYVDKELNDKLLRQNTVPVILVTLPEHVHMFREVCTFKNLCPHVIEKDPNALTGKQLREDALKVMAKSK